MVRVRQSDTIARVRAQLLHVLYEIGHAEHQFRLRFNGVYLRDADMVQDYDVMENAILKMITLTKNNDIEVGYAMSSLLHRMYKWIDLTPEFSFGINVYKM